MDECKSKMLTRNHVHLCVDILEMDKKDDYSLGKTLKIGNSKYSDLDELLVSHIESILSKTETLMASPKYKESATDLRKCVIVYISRPSHPAGRHS